MKNIILINVYSKIFFNGYLAFIFFTVINTSFVFSGGSSNPQLEEGFETEEEANAHCTELFQINNHPFEVGYIQCSQGHGPKSSTFIVESFIPVRCETEQIGLIMSPSSCPEGRWACLKLNRNTYHHEYACLPSEDNSGAATIRRETRKTVIKESKNQNNIFQRILDDKHRSIGSSTYYFKRERLCVEGEQCGNHNDETVEERVESYESSNYRIRKWSQKNSSMPVNDFNYECNWSVVLNYFLDEDCVKINDNWITREKLYYKLIKW
jgi:hypothetical protein